MAKGYNSNKAKEKQQARAEKLEVNNFGENVLENLTREFEIPKTEDSLLVKIKIKDLYAAPNNKEWDGFDKLTPDEEFELNQSIYNHGQLEPIIVWELPKEDVAYLYEGDVPKYNFSGSKYMILAGHSRSNSHLNLYEQTGDEKFLTISAIIRKDISIDTAQYIIKVTNIIKRNLSRKDRREGIAYLYRKLNTIKTEGMNIAKKIAEDSKTSLRTVNYQIAISQKLIDEFIQMYDSGKLTQNNILKLTRINKQLQQWMYNTYGELITDGVMKNFQNYFDRKELIETLFVDKEIDYIEVATKIPSHLEKKFREMVKNWVKRNK